VGTVLLPPRDPNAPSEQPPPDPEALIEEARTRQRRRRRRLAAVLVATAIGVGIALFAIRGGSQTVPAVEHLPGRPAVNVRAFAGQGRLAFISGNAVWVLDGQRHSLRSIASARGRHPLQPSFSADGRWLAFAGTHTPPADVAGGAPPVGQLWLAHGDGSDAHAVAGLTDVQPVGWSSAGNVLAVVAGPISNRVPFGVETTVRLVTPNGAVRTLVRARSIRGAVWSPDGRRLAVVTEDARLRDTLAVYPISGGQPIVWERFAPRTRLNGMNQILVDPAGWWQGFGIGLWVYGNGATHSNDTAPLDVVAAPGAKPRYLANTLSDRTTRVVAAGGMRLAVVADISHGINGGRLVWDAKQTEICAPAGGCAPVVVSRKTVTLDPAWSPDAARLAFVQAPDLTSSGWQQRVLQRWYADHTLLLYDAHAKTVTTLRQTRGATAPVWSADGRSLLFVADDGLWLLPRGRHTPLEIAAPLFTGKQWPAYYGQMTWPAQFSWSSG
jgi:dipeptidyl aminopeptidase/acylaminoacyl peptidase